MATKKIVSIIFAVVILAALIGTAAFGYYYAHRTSVPTKTFNDLTPEEKEALKKTLNAPQNTSQLSNQERKEALDSLTPTSTQSKLSPEERSAMLRSLQAN
ncbi:MAG TPA: hypothetical protein VIR98_01500 [Candidatus Paceibacterota bacterium]|jgi:hypothetical protein